MMMPAPPLVVSKQKVAVLLGGNLLPERRKAALEGEKPRIDIMEMESRFESDLFDYVWLEQQAKNEVLARVLVWAARKTGMWSEFLTLRAVWSLRQYDFIFASGEDVGVPAALLLRALRIKKPQLVMRTEQPVYGSTPRRRWVSTSILRVALPRLKAILCRTKAHARFLREEMNQAPGKALFLPETTDTHYFNRSRLATEEVGNLPPTPYLLSAGLEMRDYETLIEAVRGLPVTAVIAAGSPWAKVRYTAPQAGLPDNVQINSFSPKQMRALYGSAALVILPIKPTTRACGMNVILEAWSMGRPVIAAQTQGLESYIEDGKTGLFFTPGDAEELRKAILFLLDNQAAAQRLAAAGQAKVRSQYCLENYLEAVRQTLFAPLERPYEA